MSEKAPPVVFPDKIITEILTRLPAKPLCLFKTVSKRWNSIIYGPTFTSAYISRNSSSWAILDRVINVLPVPTSTGPAWFRHVEPPRVSYLTVNIGFLSGYSVVVAASKGFLLFASTSGEKWDTYFVGNPITRKWVRLPQKPNVNHRGYVGLATRVDPVSGLVDRFMVVDFVPVLDLETKKACLVSYDSETGEWEEKKDSVCNIDNPWKPNGGSFEFERRIHWVDFCVGIVVWEADPFRNVGKRKTKCRYIPLPEGCLRKHDDVKEIENSRCIGVSAGFIQFMEVVEVESESECDSKLWRLNDYEAGEWSLVYKESIWVEKKLGVVVLPKPWFCHLFESDGVYFQINEKVYFINP